MEQVNPEPVAWMRELVAEGLWHRKRKALDLPAEYLPSSRTDFVDEAAAIISNATPQPAAVDGLVSALRSIADAPAVHCAREEAAWGMRTIARQALAQIERKPDAE